jgi:hypothetical protein
LGHAPTGELKEKLRNSISGRLILHWDSVNAGNMFVPDYYHGVK